MTTKFRPQTAATRTARATWTGRITAHGDRRPCKLPVAISWHERKLRFRMLDVRRLRVLRELAARGTIAATADALGYTAPAVSQQLAALEREAGVALLERNGRRRRLTPAGEELVAAHGGHPARAGGGRGGARAHDHARRRRAPLRGVRERAPDPAPARDRRARRSAIPTCASPRATWSPRTACPRSSSASSTSRSRRSTRSPPPRPTPRSSAPTCSTTRCASRCRRTTRWPAAARSTCATLEHEPWIAGREGSFCHLVVDPLHARGRLRARLTHITNDFAVSYALVAGRRRRRARARAGGPAAARRRRAARQGRAAEPADLRRRARGQQRAPGDRGDARSAHRALSTESSRPGKRSSSSSRRSRFTSAVPSARCSITPRLAQDAEVMRARGLGHGQVEGAAAALALGGEGAHDLEPDRIGERVQDAGQLERVGGRMMQSSRHVFDCTTLIERLVRWSSYFRMKGPGMTPPSSPPKRPPFRRVVVFTGRAS